MNLFPHQQEGVIFLKEKRRVILADVMGLGKTLQAIVAAKDLTNGAVIICPATLKTNWAREILKWDDDASIRIADAGEIYAYHQGEGSNWLVANYDILARQEVNDAITDAMPSTLILDEAHYIKNATAIRSKAALQIAEMATNVFLLTGTPIMNRPMELFSLLKAIDHPLTAGQHAWYSYARTYCGGFMREFYRWVTDEKTGRKVKRKISFLDTSGATNLDKLAEKISPYFLRRTKDALQEKLPEKIITNEEIDLDAATWKKYDTAWETYITYLANKPQGEDEGTSVENAELAKHIIEINKLKQVASEGKIGHITDMVENIIEQDEKVIIFTQYTNTLEGIARSLRSKKIETVTLSGADNAEERQKAIDAFQAGTAQAFVANIKAGGVGITLTSANTVIFADMEWTPALHSQAEDRAHRIGQRKLVNVHYIVARGTVDEDIIDLLGKKEQVIQAILEGGEADTKDITGDAIKRIAEKARGRNWG